MKYTAHDIYNWSDFVINFKYGKTPARPENYKYVGFMVRLKNAFGVLTGKYDALDWD